MNSISHSQARALVRRLRIVAASVQGALCGLLIGLYCSSAAALTGVDFTNTGTTIATTGQYENNTVNNVSSVVVLPKGLSVSKTADVSALSTPTQAGDQIAYRIDVANRGLLGLTNVQPVDSIIAAADLLLDKGDLNANNILDASEIWVFRGVYTITQSDLDSNGGGDGDIDNVVSVSTNELAVVSDDAEVMITQAPSFTVAKDVDRSTVAAPGILNYSIDIKNTGNLTLTGVNPVDTLPDGSPATLTGPVSDSGIAGALDVGETWRYTTLYTVTQDNLDNLASLTNTVEVSTTQTGTAKQSSSAETVISTTPDLVISKIVDQATLAVPGILNYEIAIENTGNVTLTDVDVADVLPGGAAGVLVGPLSDTGIAGAIDVGETWDFQLAYPVGQAQIDTGGTLINTASVTTVETGATPYEASAETQIIREPQFSVSKLVDKSNIAAPANLTYTIAVTNTGNVSLTGLTLVDLLPDGNTGLLTGPSGDNGVPSVLDVGESWTYTGAYTTTQAEIDATADLVNTVSVTSVETGTAALPATATTTISTAPDMLVEKTVSQATINTPGILDYRIKISNTGNVTLNNLVIDDILPDGSSGNLFGPLSDIGQVGAIDVGEAWEYTIDYPVTQAEIDAGATRTNTVTVSSDETGASKFSDVAVTTINRTPLFVVTKTVDATTIASPGVLNYTITAGNTGNVSLGNIVIEDILPNGSTASMGAVTGDLGIPDVIDVGETWTWTTSYSASQTEIDAGETLVNQVAVTTDEAGSGSASAQTSVNQQPSIEIVKSVEQTHYVIAGDTLDYTLVATNNGNVALSAINVLDAGLDAGTMNCAPSTSIPLLPGSQIRCVGIHTVTTADVAVTQVDNQASVQAVDPDGAQLSATSETISVPMQRIAPIATDDAFLSPLSAQPVTLVGAGDDSDANDDMLITSLSLIQSNATDSDGDGDFDILNVAGEGTWVVDNASGSVLFTPLAGFTADPNPVLYTVSDATGLVSNQALLSIDYPQAAPVAQNDVAVNPNVESPSNPTTLNVLADNGSGADSDPENDIDISSVGFVHVDAVDTDGDGDADLLSVGDQGVWFIDNANANVTFTPAAGFLADPTPVSYTIRDATGLVSNAALITIDYPQTAPVAVDDRLDGVRIGEAATLSTLANDSDPEANLDPTTVRILDPLNGAMSQSVFVPAEGIWTVDDATGDITFTPHPDFIASPTPIVYSVFDSTGLESNLATQTITYEEPVSLVGTVWLDADRDGEIDNNEVRKAGWALQVFDELGHLIATTVTDAEGNYAINGLKPGRYRVDFYNELGVFMDSHETVDPVLPGQTLNLPLQVDPSGVVYDSISRESVAGVTLHMTNSDGMLIDASCLAARQQGQTTGIDGLYAFDVFPGAHPSCPLNEVYVIELASAPESYHPNFSTIIQYQGAAECGSDELGCAVSRTFDSDSAEANCTVDSLPGTSACEIQSQPTAPSLTDDTRYYIEFELAAGDRNVIFNHLPIDAKANDAEVLLSKSVDRREVSIGSLVKYSLTAENTKDVPAFAVEVTDRPPAGFVFVSESVQLTRSGDDAEFGTADDIIVEHGSEGIDPVNFDLISLAALETVRISYVMRVGTGVVPGVYRNVANAVGPNGIASNDVVADVIVIPDPVLQQATLIGKVFDDRDADGTQDNADAAALKLKSNFYGWNSLELGDLPARRSPDENPQTNAIVVNMPLSESNHFRISTREGTRLSVDELGNVTEAHVGLRARGLNSQDIRVCTRRAFAIPTPRTGMSASDEASDVLEIVLTNHGISERGIPGVRLATVTGLLVETDAFGRYSIPDVAAGDTGIGQNFVLKVDVATLPDGSRFTTENPYVLRVLNNSLNRINFGVNTQPQHSVDPYSTGNLPCVDRSDASAVTESIVVNLGSVFFDTGAHSVREDQAGIVRDIISKLREYGGGDIVIEAHTDARGSAAANLELAERRATEIRDLLKNSLGVGLMENISIEVDRAGLSETEQ